MLNSRRAAGAGSAKNAFFHPGREGLIELSAGHSAAICATSEYSPVPKCASQLDLSAHTSHAQLTPRCWRRERIKAVNLGPDFPVDEP